MMFWSLADAQTKKTITFYMEKVILGEHTLCFMCFVPKKGSSHGFGSWVSFYRARNIIKNPLLRCWAEKMTPKQNDPQQRRVVGEENHYFFMWFEVVGQENHFFL